MSQNSQTTRCRRLPPWLHQSWPEEEAFSSTGLLLQKHHLHTVCQEANCPNRLTCWSERTATFLVMGRACTRSCPFCNIEFTKHPPPLDPEEPIRLASSVEELKLQHIVITMVTRDDLPDGGAHYLPTIIDLLRKKENGAIEVLTSDFDGNEKAWDTVLAATPDVFGHNIETVQRLTPKVRHKATYEGSLHLLRYIKHRRKEAPVKSGFMVGLGETYDEVIGTLRDLASVGCDIVTIGQYLQPNPHKLPVKSFLPPEVFDNYAAEGKKVGISHMQCGPLVRSSYKAATCLQDYKRGITR